MKRPDLRLLHETAGARRPLGVTIGAGFVTASLIILQAQLLARGIAHADSGWHALRPTLLVLAAVVVGRGLCVYATEVSALRAAAQVRSRLRGRLTGAIVRAGPDWLTRKRSGELVTLATRGLDSLDDYFARYLPALVLACVVPLAILVRMAGADLTSAVVVAVTVPLIPLFLVLIGLHTRARTQGQWQQLARLGSHFLDVVQGLPTLTIFGRAQAQTAVIRAVSDRHRRATMDTLRVAFLSALVLELLATLSTALVAVEVGLRLLSGRLPYETALLVLLLAPEAFLPLRAVGAQFHSGAPGAAATHAVLDVCVEALEREPPAGGSACDLRRDTIVLRGVSVDRPDRSLPALDHVDLVLDPGTHLLIHGASGAGKSTLLAVLLRTLNATGGTVTVGGVELDRLDLDGWRRQVAWAPQRPHLFAGSVADNIRLGRPDASSEDVLAVASLTGLDLPGGVETAVDEGGSSLSSGQRQKLSLARALLLDAPVLLLDEPTAHLDDSSAARVCDRISRAYAGRTLIVVSHDDHWRALPTMRALEGGRLLPPPLTVA